MSWHRSYGLHAIYLRMSDITEKHHIPSPSYESIWNQNENAKYGKMEIKICNKYRYLTNFILNYSNSLCSSICEIVSFHIQWSLRCKTAPSAGLRRSLVGVWSHRGAICTKNTTWSGRRVVT